MAPYPVAKKCHSARPNKNGSSKEWVQYIRDFDQNHKLLANQEFKHVASFRLAAAVLSTKATERCILLLKSWRAQASLIDPFRTTSNDWVIRAAMFAKRAEELEAHHELNNLLSRLADFYFASEIDSAKAGSTRNDSSHINAVLNQLKWANNESARTTLQNRLKIGRKLRSICKKFGTGLLCLVPFSSDAPYHISATVCLKMKDVEIREFQDLVSGYEEFMRLLCEFGTSLLNILVEHREIEFEYERREICSLDQFTEDELLSLLKPVPYLKTNFYNSAYDWPKPDNWQWSWPTDPTWVPSEHPCDLCGTTQCDCISSLPTNRYRICYYDRKGRGIQAYASSRGGLVFNKNEYIGELTGELVPPATYDSPMTLDFRRPDLPEEPVVCQVYCGDKGNWIRLVNHSCNPCARFVFKVVSGKARVMLQASREIYDGMEVTAKYGSDRLKGDNCLCEVCEAKRVTVPKTTIPG
ncbi:SET domain-containing protein [Zopfia rhizophila CBS 207.26]|uniref:SET domain-containing protein n=1 Tax=Zopfia rhizophila CBS 207.26 TaxID=1314779 RepID=A0A6A6ECL7_9PEZI|nr:SET domain-containing protein [Zopfia rhizophila CBS 207.26]